MGRTVCHMLPSTRSHLSHFSNRGLGQINRRPGTQRQRMHSPKCFKSRSVILSTGDLLYERLILKKCERRWISCSCRSSGSICKSTLPMESFPRSRPSGDRAMIPRPSGNLIQKRRRELSRACPLRIILTHLSPGKDRLMTALPMETMMYNSRTG